MSMDPSVQNNSLPLSENHFFPNIDSDRSGTKSKIVRTFAKKMMGFLKKISKEV